MADRIPISGSIAIEPDELEISYIRSPGPGGQNVNKVASAAQLRFDLRNSPSLPEPLKLRAMALAGSKLSNEGILVITASRFRAQPMNRDDAIARLVALLAEAAVPPKPRRATRPTLGSKRRRVDTKVKRGATKRLRSGKPEFD
jgi:ribosome-associated protein